MFSQTKTRAKSAREIAVEEARTRLSLLLKYPDDLSGKLDSLRAKFVAEKAAVDAQLKASTQGQLDDCEHGLENMTAVKLSVDTVRKNFTNVVINGDKGVSMIPCFTRIRKLSIVHQNFLKTREVIKRFQALSNRVEQLALLLAKERKSLLGPAEELVKLHYEAFQLKLFRVKTLQQVKTSTKEVQASVAAYFRKLEGFLDDFDAHLGDLACSLLPLVQAGQHSVVVRLAKILDFEERILERPPMLSPTLASGIPAIPKEGNAKEPALAVNELLSRFGTSQKSIDSARAAFFDAVHASISLRFSNLLVEHKKEVPKLLSTAMEAVVTDLTLVFDSLVMLFPKKYKIFPFYVLEYHRHVYDMLNKIIADNVETASILLLLRWAKDYYIEMEAKLGISKEILEPKLLDGQEKQLIDEYLRVVSQKLDEWMRNLLASESREFSERKNPPDTDSGGAYVLSAAVILSNMISQQVDIAMDASRGKLLLDVLKECRRVLGVYQTQFTQLSQTEFARFVADPAKCVEGIAEYTMALANDSFKSTEFLEQLTRRVEKDADEDIKTLAVAEIGAALDGFTKLCRTASGILVDAAFGDLKAAFALLFTTPAWYQGEVMSDIVATLKDYCNDYSQHMHEYLFGKLVGDMMDKFVIMWIESMKSKSTKFKVPSCWPIMETDMRLVIEFFSIHKSSKRVQKHFSIMDKLFTLICSNRKMVFLDFYALWKHYNDVPLTFIEDLLLKRDDMDKSGVKDAMEAIKHKTKEEPPPESQKSVFSTLK